MISIVGNKKGFSLFFAIFLVILVVAVISLLSNICTQFMTFARTQGVASQNYHYAEFGIYRAEWLLKGGYITPTDGSPHSEVLAADATTNVTITVSYNDSVDYDYDLVATANNRTVRAHYAGGSIVAWD